jgi:predicted HTH transcriptional regulator
MEALSPVKTCDPWAVHSAKRFEQHAGGQSTLTAVQKEILAILKESGGLTAEEVAEKLGGKLDAEALRREFATLRHMEKTRAEKRDGVVVMRLW